MTVRVANLVNSQGWVAPPHRGGLPDDDPAAHRLPGPAAVLRPRHHGRRRQGLRRRPYQTAAPRRTRAGRSSAGPRSSAVPFEPASVSASSASRARAPSTIAAAPSRGTWRRRAARASLEGARRPGRAPSRSGRVRVARPWPRGSGRRCRRRRCRAIPAALARGRAIGDDRGAAGRGETLDRRRERLRRLVERLGDDDVEREPRRRRCPDRGPRVADRRTSSMTWPDARAGPRRVVRRASSGRRPAGDDQQAGSSAACGSAPHSASVTKGMTGWSSRRYVSRRHERPPRGLALARPERRIRQSRPSRARSPVAELAPDRVVQDARHLAEVVVGEGRVDGRRPSPPRADRIQRSATPRCAGIEAGRPSASRSRPACADETKRVAFQSLLAKLRPSSSRSLMNSGRCPGTCR